MQRVSQATVLKHWLRLECHKPEGPALAVESLSERAALDRLLRLKPGAAAFVWREKPVRWYRTTLSRAEFERLRVVEGPDDLLWRALSTDGTVLGAARRIAREEIGRASCRERVCVGV